MELVFSKEIIKKENKFIKLLPFLVILTFSLIGSYTFFYDGYPIGDDYSFHFSNVLDIVKQLEEGNLSVISSNLASGYGVGKQLFYSPLSHISCAFIFMIIKNFGCDLTLAFKINAFISIFVSNIFTYILTYKISKNRIIALVCASFFAFYPYRMFDIICRIAYAEGYAYMFIPIFFLGLYELINLKELKIKPFIEIIIGAAGLYLSHNITALFTYLFGFIFLLCYIDKIIKLIKKDKLILLYAIITLVITLGLCAKIMFSSFELLNMNYYNISVDERMWTNKDYIIGRSDYMNYSGFLNYNWLNYYGNEFKIDEIKTISLVKDIIIYFSLTISFVLIDIFLKKFIFKKYHIIVSLIYYVTICLIFVRRLEFILGVVAFIILYLIYQTCIYKKNPIKSNRFGFIMISFTIICLLLICFSFLWHIMPSIFYTIQFPWRLWTLFSFFACLFMSYYMARYHFTIVPFMILSTFLLVVSQPLIEKRIIHDNTSFWLTETNEEIYTKTNSTGANMEYYPTNFYYYDKYESKYRKSLYPYIKKELCWNIGQNPNYYNPVILEGVGNIDVISKKAPKIELELTIYEESLIQMPLIYYPGYKITATDKNNVTKDIEVVDIDGLISFKIEEGEYKINTSYVGTNIQHLGINYFKLSFGLLILFYFLDIEIEKRRKYMK